MNKARPRAVPFLCFLPDHGGDGDHPIAGNRFPLTYISFPTRIATLRTPGPSVNTAFQLNDVARKRKESYQREA